MKRAAILLLALIALFPTAAFAQNYTATLLGSNEVPPADPDGSGTASVSIVGTTVTYLITVQNIAAPTAQHIHTGVAGVNGPIVVNFTGTWVGNTLSGSTTTDSSTAASIAANPAAFYVNVHNADYPGGAVRGQLIAAVTAGSTVPTLSLTALLALAMAVAVAGAFLIRRM